MSPDQEAAAFLCCPAKAERVRIATRLRSVVDRWPWQMALVTYKGYALRTDSPLPRNVCLPLSTSNSGSDASIHQPSIPSWKIPLFSSDQKAFWDPGLKKSVQGVPEIRKSCAFIRLYTSVSSPNLDQMEISRCR